MSTRLYVINSKNEKMQIFGNDDFPMSFIEELERQGLKYDESFENFPIKELQPLVDIIKSEFEKKWKNYEKNKEFYKEINYTNGESIADWTNDFIDAYSGKFKCRSLYSITYSMIENGYMFILYNLIKFLKDDIDFLKSDKFKDIFILKVDANVRFSMY